MYQALTAPTMNAVISMHANHMWVTLQGMSGLKMAWKWLVTTKRPSLKYPPVGTCIHELATRIQKADIEAPSATMHVAKRCTFLGTRSQPNNMMPMNVASSMKAIAPSNPSMFPKKSPPAVEKTLQFV